MVSSSRSDGPTTLDLLVRIIPPIPEVHFVRPPINLGLVLDRSGSMAGAKKMTYAREAAAFAVQPDIEQAVLALDHRLALRGLGDVAAIAAMRLADIRGGRLGLFGVEIEQRHPRALLGEALGCRLTDAALRGSTGDDRDLAFKQQ